MKPSAPAFLKTGVVSGVANASTLLTAFYQNDAMLWPGMTEEQKNIFFRDIEVNSDFGPAVGWTVLRGRDFSRAYLTDSSAAIVNETGARALGFKNPIGKTVRFENKVYTIIGVTKDMISNSPYDKVQPAVFLGQGGALSRHYPHQTRRSHPYRAFRHRIRVQTIQSRQPIHLSF